jgi:hypothetical protein
LPLALRVKETATDVIEQPSRVCTFCNAVKWKNETKGFCCQLGKVILTAETQLFPIRLKELYGKSNFLSNIRVYNSAFAFTSLEK